MYDEDSFFALTQYGRIGLIILSVVLSVVVVAVVVVAAIVVATIVVVAAAHIKHQSIGRGREKCHHIRMAIVYCHRIIL